MSDILLFDIRRFSIHDGPGIRTTVFFKGCPLHCAWCHNPESRTFTPELMLLPGRCTGCGTCAKLCPQGASKNVNGKLSLDRSLCQKCGQCVSACYADARQLVGSTYSVPEVMREILKDAVFYAESGGGVTFSGGEPSAQAEALLELLIQCKEGGLHTALDTCGYCEWETFERLLPYVDLVLFDLKHMNSDAHKQLTGVGNELILANLERIVLRNVPVWVRIPLVPGQNDSPENLQAAARFLAGLPQAVRVCLLPYHRVAESKYANLGLMYKLPDLPEPTQTALEEASLYFSQAGFEVQQGG